MSKWGKARGEFLPVNNIELKPSRTLDSYKHHPCSTPCELEKRSFQCAGEILQSVRHFSYIEGSVLKYAEPRYKVIYIYGKTCL